MDDEKMAQIGGFLIIGCFVSTEFKDIVKDVLKCLILGDKGSVKVEKSETEETQPVVIEGRIPLILCESLDDLKRRGVLCPDEFVISRKDLLPPVNEDGKLSANPLEILKRRLDVLGELYAKKDFTEKLRNWFAGAFRLYLMLDATTHGTSEYIDLKKVREDEDLILKRLAEFSGTGGNQGQNDGIEETVKKLRNRFCSHPEYNPDDPLLSCRRTFEVLFPEYFKKDGISNDNGRSLRAFVDSENKVSVEVDDLLKVLKRIYEDREQGDGQQPLGHDERLPIAYGERARHVTPSGKLNLLLIDDKVDESPLSHLKDESQPKEFEKTIHPDDWRLLKNLFNVQKLPIERKEDEKDPLREAEWKIRKLQQAGLTFNLILVDLCLGNRKNGTDLDGYAMIRLVKKFFPSTRVVVYSRFDDMEHMVRAFAEGAEWFLVKGQEAKLPRHVLTLLDRPGWRCEWHSVKNSSRRPVYDCCKKGDEFYRRFMRSEAWQYLTYKCLEDLPGNRVQIEQMGGGISSAVTFKATKGMRKGDMFLQTPQVIKIDSAYNTMMEYRRYFRRIRPYIANESGRIEKPEIGINRDNSAIVYTFAGKQNPKHELRAMGSMMDNDVLCRSSCDYEKYRKAIDQIFDEILPKIHQVAPALEAGDYIAKTRSDSVDVEPSYQADAFDPSFDEGEEDRIDDISTFPNIYFDEVDPKDFWKNCVSRMQPWRRITIDKVESFSTQKIIDLKKTNDTTNAKRLLFHDIRQDPLDPGRKIIEALVDHPGEEDDRHLVWLEGDASDFVARFRRQVFPGDALWVDETDCKDAEGQSGKDWLFAILKEDELSEFCKWILKCKGFAHTNGNEGDCKDPKKSPVFDCYTKLQDALLAIAREVKNHAEEWDCHCPVGIVHGDLNLNNIMLDARIHEARDLAPDTTRTVADVWLIDFARSRRDIIAHDFNVFFTSTLSRLFDKRILGDCRYVRKLKVCFKDLVEKALVGESEGLNGIVDCIENEGRMAFVYKILRRTRMAALQAGVSQNMYLLTTGLACLYSVKIFLNSKRRVELAAGCFAAAWICYDLLVERIGEANKLKNLVDELLEVKKKS